MTVQFSGAKIFSASVEKLKNRPPNKTDIGLNRLMSVFFIFDLSIENFDRNDGFAGDLYNEISLLG
jgi:hypothetical protein